VIECLPSMPNTLCLIPTITKRKKVSYKQITFCVVNHYCSSLLKLQNVNKEELLFDIYIFYTIRGSYRALCFMMVRAIISLTHLKKTGVSFCFR
jgi:hypothetical protein